MFQQLYQGVKSNYVNNRPRHLVEPGTSTFSVKTRSEFESMTAHELQDLH